MIDTFETSAADFAQFAAKQGYPANLLWVTSADVVFWRLQFFVWMGDPGERRNEAKRRFSTADHEAATAGVECRKDAEVIDETPAAYKNIISVLNAQRDLVEVVHTLKQVVCVKG